MNKELSPSATETTINEVVVETTSQLGNAALNAVELDIPDNIILGEN